MDDFMFGAYTTALAAGEIIAAVTIPCNSAQSRWAYQKFCRKTGEFAEASCAAWFSPERRLGRIVLGALDGPPMILNDLTLAFTAEGPATMNTPAFEAKLQCAIAEAAPDRDAVDHQLMNTVVRRCLAQFT